MYYILLFFTLLAHMALQGMEQEQGIKGFLSLLSPDLKSELTKYADTKVDLLPKELQAELVQFLVGRAAQPFVKLDWQELIELARNLKPIFLQATDAKKIDQIFSQAGFGMPEKGKIAGSVKYDIYGAYLIASVLNIPAVTAWLKDQLKKSAEWTWNAQSVLVDIVRELGKLKQEGVKGTVLSEKQKELVSTLENSIKTLLALGVNVNSYHSPLYPVSPLAAAAGTADFETVRLLVNHGANVNYHYIRESGVSRYDRGPTPLETALMGQHDARQNHQEELVKKFDEIIKYLKSKGAVE